MLALAVSPGATRDVTILDVIELDMGYTTIDDQFYKTTAPQQLLDGARTGMLAYLRRLGISKVHIEPMRARPDGRGVVPAIERQLGKAIDRYGQRVDARQLVYAAIRGELRSLGDPYSVFFTAAELSGFTTALDGKAFGGIGVVLAQDAGGAYRVDEVFDDGPAARAGMAPGDHIVAIDGKSPSGLSSAAVGALLRGSLGSRVLINITRGGDSAERTMSIVRAAIHPPEVSARLVQTDVAYIALRSFGPTAGQQVRRALIRLRTQGARSSILDLRGNGGGYESSAVAVASLFVPSGTIVITQTHHGQKRLTVADGSAPGILPLVVLVDGDSASGSELVTGAIADHRLAKVVGTRTFGKGLVQTLFPLPDGSAMKVTTARYFTPNGRDINHIGITPDVIVAQGVDAVRGVPGRDAQLDAALMLLSAAPATTSPPPANDR